MVEADLQILADNFKSQFKMQRYGIQKRTTESLKMNTLQAELENLKTEESLASKRMKQTKKLTNDYSRKSF